MRDRVNPFDRFTERFRIENVPINYLYVIFKGLQIIKVTTRKIIVYFDAPARFNKAIDYVRSDKSRSSGDKNFPVHYFLNYLLLPISFDGVTIYKIFLPVAHHANVFFAGNRTNALA